MTDVPPELAVHREAPDRNLALELVRVTEAAAMAAGRWVGRLPAYGELRRDIGHSGLPWRVRATTASSQTGARTAGPQWSV